MLNVSCLICIQLLISVSVKRSVPAPGELAVCVYMLLGSWRGILNEDTHVEIENTGIFRRGRGCV